MKIHFNARKVFWGMGNVTRKPINVKVLLNHDAEKSIIVDKYSIYEAVTQAQFSNDYLELIATEPRITIYTFTFGS